MTDWSKVCATKPMMCRVHTQPHSAEGLRGKRKRSGKGPGLCCLSSEDTYPPLSQPVMSEGAVQGAGRAGPPCCVTALQPGSEGSAHSLLWQNLARSSTPLPSSTGERLAASLDCKHTSTQEPDPHQACEARAGHSPSLSLHAATEPHCLGFGNVT